VGKATQIILGLIGLVAILAAIIVPILIVPSGLPDTLQMRVAFWALGVSVVTFLAVAAQIKIASDEVGYVKQDLLNNQRQLEEAMRRPNLICVFLHSHRNGVGINAQYQETTLQCSVVNTGDRLSTSYLVEVFVLQSALRQADANAGSSRVVNNQGYRLFQATSPQGRPIYPNRMPQTPTPAGMAFAMASGPGSTTVLWRIYDEYGTYPKDDYGRYEITPENNL
jgi:hypothetical protein